MNAIRLVAFVNDLAQMEEVDLRALLAASAQELARRRGVIRAAQDLGALARQVAEEDSS